MQSKEAIIDRNCIRMLLNDLDLVLPAYHPRKCDEDQLNGIAPNDNHVESHCLPTTCEMVFVKSNGFEQNCNALCEKLRWWSKLM